MAELDKARERAIIDSYRPICLCNKIRKGIIAKAIQNGADTFDKVRRRTGAGTGPCAATRCGPMVRGMLGEPVATCKECGWSILKSARSQVCPRCGVNAAKDYEGEIMIQGIDHIGIVAQDMDRTIDFYTSLLGFTLLARYKPKTTYHREMAYLRFPGASGAKLELYTLASPPPGEPNYDYRLGVREIALSVGDVKQEVDRLRKAGVEILAEPVRLEAPGVAEDSPVKRRMRAAIKAPDGVIVGLYVWG